jgi:uncharacterized protein (TIGR03435 family)
MQELADTELLRQYAHQNSEAAFAELVTRHVPLVYSAALRKTGNPSAAEEVTQVVFTILARKARGLRRETALAGWLYQAARLTAANFLRTEIRRARREQEALMQSLANETGPETWRQIMPLLEDAMGRLGERERNAVVLRFFEGKSFQEVGVAAGASENAAKKRVAHALEKLRRFFLKRGVNSTAAAIGETISANSVHAVPVGLAKTISAVAITKGATASFSTLTLIKGALKIMAWTKMKTAVVVGVVAILTAGTTTVIVKKVINPNAWADDPSYWRLNNPPLATYPPALILRPTRFPGHGGGIGDGSRYLEMDAAIQELIAIAYGFPDTRIVFPAELSEGRPRPGYDLLLTLPNQPLQALRETIQRRFGLVGHTETIVTNAFLVRVANPYAPGLKPASPVDGQQVGWYGENWSLTIRDQPLDNFLGEYIESQVGQPVFNETGLTGRYDLHVQWHPQAGESDKSAFERALSEQLGLELVPTNMPVKMLVVEKTK